MVEVGAGIEVLILLWGPPVWQQQAGEHAGVGNRGRMEWDALSGVAD